MIEIRNIRGQVIRTVVADTLVEANMIRASLRRANMSRADMRRADMSESDMRGANLRGANMRGANMSRADMRGADLWDADLSEANMWNVIGNMQEIKSAQFDRWSVTWAKSPDGADIVQIGCQRHTLAEWLAFDDETIHRMDDHALAWWRQYRSLVIAMVETSPAVPYGRAK